ncbi:putative transcription factor B3-Domain family [Helianthus anomalus]
MDSRKNAHSFIAFIDKEEPDLMAISNDFAYNLWGDKIPYYKTIEIRDSENLRNVRIRKTNDGPVFTDGWILLVRYHQLKYKDGVLIKAVGQLKFEVLCFKDLVCQNSYIIAQVETKLGMSLMADNFFNKFYDKNIKGGMAKVYFGERFWNVRLEGTSEGGYFKAGWRKVVEEVPQDNDYFLVFTRLDSKTFDVSVFDPNTGTEVFLKKLNQSCRLMCVKMILKEIKKIPYPPSDFATNLWGDKVPYGKTVQIRDGDSLRFVRIRKRNGEPIFTDGWIMLVREKDLEFKDGVLITATGPYTFNVSCFKEYVYQNSYFTAQINDVPQMTLEASSQCCCFKDGWLKLVEEVPLENEAYLVFTMIDLKTFELYVF